MFPFMYNFRMFFLNMVSFLQVQTVLYTLFSMFMPTSCYTLWYCVMPCDALWCLVMPCDTVWCLVMPCDALWCLVMPCDTVWCRVMPCDALWYRVMPCDAVWCRVMPCDAVWCLVNWIPILFSTPVAQSSYSATQAHTLPANFVMCDVITNFMWWCAWS